MGVLDSFRLDGKVALVTGASRELGLQLAEALGEAGAAVAISDRRDEGLAQTLKHLEAKGIRAISATFDVSRNDQVAAAVAEIIHRLGGIDILMNSEGAPLEGSPLDAWDNVIKLNVDGTFYVSQAVGLHMIKRGQGGRIINIASAAGLRDKDHSLMSTLAYDTGNGAVVNFTRALAATLAEHNITVNCICPGSSLTDLRGVALLFASDASAYITGQVIAVDGSSKAA
jgi:gluconate 5-dehydrogenase